MVKKILLVSEYSPGALAWNCLHTLKQLGYEVAQFSCAYRANNSHRSLSKWGHITRSARNFLINKLFLRTVQREQPDIIFLIKADNLTAKTLKQAKQISGAKLINWYPDNPFTFWNGNSNAQILLSLPLYDLFAIWSQMLIDPLKAAGCTKVIYAPFGYDHTFFEQNFVISEQEKKRYTHDVCFLGSWDPEREWWIEQLVNRMPQLNIAVWGNGWGQKWYVKGPAQYNDTMVKISRCSKIMLNFMRQQNLTAHNMRTFEIPAAQGFMLTERTAEQAQFLFREPEEIACFATPEELVEKITYFLEHPTARQNIATGSHQRVKSYRLVDVLGEILGAVEQNRRSSAQALDPKPPVAPSPTIFELE